MCASLHLTPAQGSYYNLLVCWRPAALTARLCGSRGGMAEWLMAAVCKTVLLRVRRFESSSLHQAGTHRAHIAQPVERVLGKNEVTSSNLVVGSTTGSGK